MIAASLEKLGRYKVLSKNFADAIAWIEAGSWMKFPGGKFPIDGTRLLALVMSGESKPLASCAYETHRRYADIQILLEGKEYVMVRDSEGMPVTTPYSAEKEIEFLGDGNPAAEQRVVLEPGVAAIFFPEDAHKPCVAQSAPVKYCFSMYCSLIWWVQQVGLKLWHHFGILYT
ncbi:MAG: YhcH/YjgK/YiaL family protein [Spirochaetota bacterium]